MRTPLIRISVRSVRSISILLLAAMLAGCMGAGGAASTAAGCPTAAPTGNEASAVLANARTATLKTSKGSFTMELYGDKAPIATANFVALARCGFYAGITFHRVLAGFVIQAGDPQTKTRRDAFDKLGSGGPGYGFAIEPPADGLNYDKYVVAMANAARPDTNGSQFFVDLADLNDRLSRDYTIFGKVVEGTDVVDAIGAVATNGKQGVPIEPVIIESVVIGAG
jgi:cyclophilin family peptidyl-prolyl cis-trans isomerase